jgi:hypothetical protein
MAGKQFHPVLVGAGAVMIAELLVAGASGAPALAHDHSKPVYGYSSGPLYAPRPLTIRRGKRAAVRAARPVEPLRARDLICPNPRNANASCVAPWASRVAVSLDQAPGADAFRLGSMVLAPPRLPVIETGQMSPAFAYAIAAAAAQPVIYPDLMTRAPVFGAAARPPIYPELYGRPGYGYFVPMSAPRARRW